MNALNLKSGSGLVHAFLIKWTFKAVNGRNYDSVTSQGARINDVRHAR